MKAGFILMKIWLREVENSTRLHHPYLLYSLFACWMKDGFAGGMRRREAGGGTNSLQHVPLSAFFFFPSCRACWMKAWVLVERSRGEVGRKRVGKRRFLVLPSFLSMALLVN